MEMLMRKPEHERGEISGSTQSASASAYDGGFHVKSSRVTRFGCAGLSSSSRSHPVSTCSPTDRGKALSTDDHSDSRPAPGVECPVEEQASDHVLSPLAGFHHHNVAADKERFSNGSPAPDQNSGGNVGLTTDGEPPSDLPMVPAIRGTPRAESPGLQNAKAFQVDTQPTSETDAGQLVVQPTPDANAILRNASTYILSTLQPPADGEIAAFFSHISSNNKREYIIEGNPFIVSFFTELHTPQQWVTSLQMDILVSLSWRHLSSSLISRRVTFLDSLFASILSDKRNRFKHQLLGEVPAWHPVLLSYVRGDVGGRDSAIEW